MLSLFSSRSRARVAPLLIAGATALGSVALGAGFLETLTAAPAGAVTNTPYVVTSNADASGTCPSPTACTLPTAVTDYDNLTSGTATITFAAPTTTVATIAHVQSSTYAPSPPVSGVGGMATPLFPSTPTPGDTVVVTLMLQSSGTVSAANISGLGVTNWTLQGTNSFSTYADVTFSGIVGPSPTNSLTVTTTPNTVTWYPTADEFSGVGSVSGFVGNSGVGTATGPNITLDPATGQSVDVWGDMTDNSSSPPVAPWVADHLGVGGLSSNLFGAYQLNAPHGNTTASWSSPGTETWGVNGVLLSAASANTYMIGAGPLVFDNSHSVPLTVTGNGEASTIIDAGGTTANLEFESGSVTLKNLTVQHSSGGAISVTTATLTLNTVELTNNTTLAALDIASGSVVASPITVTANSGGGISNAGTLQLSGSTVSANTTTGNGAGILNTGSLTSISNTVTGNTAATGLGGGIYNTNSEQLTKTTVGGSTLAAGNTALFGGGIYNEGGSTNLSTSTVSDNTATGAGSGDGFGGGIYNLAGKLTSIGSTVSGNLANGDTTSGVGGNGGGIYIAAATLLTLQQTTISANKAQGTGGNGGNGGGIYMNAGPLTGTLDTITANTATGNGGGLYVANTTGVGKMSQSTISSNTAANGGGIYSAGGGLIFNIGVLTGNTATTGNGGGLDLAGGSVFVNDSSVTYNAAHLHGGGIYEGTGDLELISNLIEHNTAASSGGDGGFYQAGGTITQSGNTYSGNTPAP